MDYDPNKNYVFKDAEGNVAFTSKGDNQYVWQSITQGVPIYVNEKGEWYTQPYLESTPTGVTVHMTDWFKNSDEYGQWQNTILPQIQSRTLDVDLFNQAQNLLKSLGNQSLLRFTTYNQAEESGITDPTFKKFVFDQFLSALNEGANKETANLVAYGSTDGNSAADFARYYKNMSKEDLSKTILKWERILDKENTKDTQEEKANVLAAYKILNLVADNPKDFGDGKEFEGLLEASEWQKFQSHITNVLQTISEGMPVVTFGARAASAAGYGLQGKDPGEGWQIENRRNQQYGFLRNEATGGGLRGTEGAQVSGNVAGSVINMAGTMAQSAVFGTFLNSKIASDSAGTALNAIGKFANTVAGGMVYDFFANDLPVDLSLFAVDLSRTGSTQEAWESQTGETQPLFGLFGPEVPSGLKYNLIGDAMLDLTMPIISVGSKAMYNKLDDITGGSVTKMREWVTLKNLSVQQKISDLPVLGTGLQKFSNWLFGPEQAAIIREGRKRAIIEGSLTPYVVAQNILTLGNHYGAEVIAPLYKKTLDDLNITDRIKKFQKEAASYGGMGKVQTKWDTYRAGVKKTIMETVQDDLPRDVKKGLLDFQRLEELKGERTLESEDLISNPKRDTQIAELEKRVAEMPEEIRKFAEDFSELNKAVEQIGVQLGLKTEDWVDALLEDPRWKNYMVRQVLLPGGMRGAGATDPRINKVLSGKRTGYYNPDQTLSPLMALDMKVHAMGNAYAWNERAKFVVASEIAQGKITAGASSVEIAEKIKMKRAEIAAQEAASAKLGYEAITKGYSNRMYDLGSVAKSVNDKLAAFDNLTAKAVYVDNNSLETKSIVTDYESGKITWAEGVRENSGLSVQDGDAVIRNTYRVGESTPAKTQPVSGGGETSLLAKNVEKFGSFMGWLRDGEFDPNDLGKDVDEVVRRKFKSLPPEIKAVIENDKNYQYLKNSGRYGDKAVFDHLASDFPLSVQFIEERVQKMIGDMPRVQDEALADMPASAKYAGVSSDGVPYEYTIEGDQITSLTKVTTDEGYSEAVSGLSGGRFTISPNYVAKIGQQNAAGVNKAVMFYRDNMPVLKTGSDVRYRVDRNYGFEPTVKNTAEWQWRRTDDGHIEVGSYPVYLGSPYRKGDEADLLASKRRECTPNPQTGIAQKPINTATVESTPIHEMGHSYMTQLAVAEINRKIDAGILKAPSSPYVIGDLVMRERCILEETFIKNAMEQLGYDVSKIVPGEVWPRSFVNSFREEASKGISGYAGEPIKYHGRLVRNPSGNPYFGEVFSEGTRYISGNNAESSRFAAAITSQMAAKGREFSMVINPKATLKENGLTAPKGLLKGDNYNFPASVKTQTQKAEWLDKQRKNNPYLKKEFTDENFQKANLWDSYFQKEISSYDPNYKTAAPDELIRKSGDFVEARRAELAQELTNEIRRLSGGEADSDLAMMVMGGNGEDIAKAMNNYVMRQIDISAEELAKNMDGGLTPENLNTARVTLWSDENLKNSTIEMLNNLVPNGKVDVTDMVDNLFTKQANGLAAYDKLSVDAKALIEEKEKLVEQLYKENQKTLKFGKEADKNSSLRDGATHVIHYKEGGEDVYVTVDDPVIASILEKPYDFKNHGLVMESAASIANFLATTYRLGTTGINPMSFIRNVLRDPIQATITAGFNPMSMTLSPEVFYRSLRQFGLDDDTILEVSKRIREWSGASTLTQEMRLGTGRNNASYRNRVQQVSNKLREATNGEVVNFLQKPLETWEQFFRNQVGQQSFIRNFRRTGDIDKAMASALFDTSNATTNFSHAIAGFKRATSTIPYLSSAINGTVSFARLFNTDPVGMVGRITAGFMVPVMAITAWNLGNEDNRRAYETLPEWFKQSHLVMADGSGNIIAFPLPEEIQQFAGTARKLIEFTNDVSPYSLATIAAQGAFGFLPFDVDGFWGDDGSLQLKEGAFQLASGLIPQAATTLYELIWQQDLFTGEDLSTYNGFNTTVNTLSNIFGTGIKQAINSLGIMAGASEKDIIGKSFQDTIARDLFGMGFDAAKNQFMSIVGSPSQLQENGKMSQATGLFKENERLKAEIDALSTKIAVSSDSEKAALEEQKRQKINDFTERVKNAMDKYQRMFSLTGGLEAWQKNRLVQLLTLGDAWSSGESTSYQYESASEAYLNERGLAQQRYVQAGLPAGPDLENLVGNNSIELQAALNRFYGGPKQAATDYRNAVENTGLKNIRNEFYGVMQQIYDAAEEQGKSPDYDMIEKIQARYLQAVDAVLVPIIQQYGINILNNNDFIDAVRKQVNGMIPSDDWRQSVRNAKKFLSSKDFPTTTVDVKKWLTQRYSSGMRNRNIASDPEVTQRLEEIKVDIDAGRGGAAKGKIQSLMSGIQKANYYISSDDFMTLTQYNNMLK